MPTTRKRKGSPGLTEEEESAKRRFAETVDQADTQPSDDNPAPEPSQSSRPSSPAPATSTTPPQPSTSTSTPTDSRAARFAALRARNAASRKSNLAETKTEARRAAIDPSALTALARRKDTAAHKLLKAEVEAAGEDFERRRAWDWTAEESARWDERAAAKAAAREGNAFADFAAEANKVYARQVGALEGDREGLEARRRGYEEDKVAAIERAVAAGGLEIVETGEGELIAVDRDGSFYSTADVAGTAHKPGREAVDRLVADIKKAEEVRMKKRKDRFRANAEDNGQDVTYINEKNKLFNQKLARFYNKYTAEIRESFERGTAM